MIGRVALAAMILPCLLGQAVATELEPPGEKEKETVSTLRILRAGQSSRLDPAEASSGSDHEVISLMYESLVRPSLTTPVRWEPCLALRWEVSEDSKKWTFFLREGVTFHDGSRLDGSAVKRSFERAAGLDKAAEPRFLPYAEQYFSAIEEIEADQRSVSFLLVEPCPLFLSIAGLDAAGVVSSKAIASMAKIDDPYQRSAWLTRNPAGTGPFTIRAPDEFAEGGAIRLIAHKGYWAGRPKVDAISMQTANDDSGRESALKRGSADFLPSLAPGLRKSMQQYQGATLHEAPGLNLSYLAMNCSTSANRPTASLKLRQAIALAIRRNELIELYEGAADKQFTLVPAASEFHATDSVPTGDELAPGDRLKKAKELVGEIGAPQSPLRMLVPDVPRPYLGLPDATADAICKQLAEIGVQVVKESKSLAQIVVDHVPNEDYDLILIGWMGAIDAHHYWGPLLGGKGRPSDNNMARFYDKDVSERINFARLETDREKRKAAYDALAKSVLDDHRPIVPLYSSKESAAWSTRWTGIAVDPTGRWRLENAAPK